MLMDAKFRQFRKIPQSKENKKQKKIVESLQTKNELNLDVPEEREEFIRRIRPKSPSKRETWFRSWKRRI